MNKKLVLIDGLSILNRAYYGIPELTNSEGLHTNGIYGFLNILFKILEEEKPEYLCVAFDVSAPTFRHELYTEYKGTRKGMPDELREQIPVMKEVLKSMGICMIEKAGLEADDILGTLAKKAEKDGFFVSLVSGDRDLLQIASEQIKIRIPKTRGGKTEVEDYYAKDVLEKYQVTPLQFIELKALMGDTSDNIPGVPKIGEKTATDLMVKYQSIEGIYENIEEITKNSIKQTLLENKHLANLSKTLATIEINGEFDFTYDAMKYENLFNKDAYVYFKKLEFKNFLNRFKKEETVDNMEKRHYETVRSLDEMKQILEEAKSKERIGLFPLTNQDGRRLIGLSIAFSETKVHFIPVSGLFTLDYVKECLDLLNKDTKISTFHAKSLYPYFNAVEERSFFDIQLAAYLLNPLKNDYHMDDIANEFLGLMLQDEKGILGKESFEEAIVSREEQIVEYACACGSICYQAFDALYQRLVADEMLTLFEEIEMPLTFVLYEMEQVGIAVDKEALIEYGNNLNGRIQELEQLIYDQAGVTFNINSPKQLGEILFGNLQMPGGKKTKTGYSTAADVLEKLSEEYPIVADILEYRGLTKLKSTYAEGLLNCIRDDGRIHSTFQQTITATGRISSVEPNLQNIPVRMELGRQIRKVFVPKPGCLFTDADYSQIELRILAHISEDTKLIEAYQTEADIHRITASQVFHTPLEEVTDTQRRNAKAVNFGIIYGISSFGLSQDLSITRKEATHYIEQYFATYPKVKQFLDEIVEEGKREGYVKTIFGRRRPIPELSSSNFMQRSFGERVAMNSPIQGTAADIIKIAMIRVSKQLKKQGLKSKLILQVHDELLIETYEDEIMEVEHILRNEMQEAVSFRVPLIVDLHTGKNWYEAK